MSIETKLAELIAQAEPLRLLPDEEAEIAGLPGIVTQINRLRAYQERGIEPDLPEVVEGADAVVKRGPGRPRKAEA